MKRNSVVLAFCALGTLSAPVAGQQAVDLPVRPVVIDASPSAALQPTSRANPAINTSQNNPQAIAPIAQPNLPPLASSETQSSRAVIRLEAVERQVSELMGRIETLEAGLDAAKADNARLARALDSAQAERIAAADAAKAPASLPSVVVAAQAIPQVTSKPAQVSAASQSKTIPESVSTNQAPAPSVSPTIAMLSDARGLLQRGQYSNAESRLSQMIANYPNAVEATEGRWLLGEARFVQSAWMPAAQAYVDYLRVTPKGPRANEALVRLAGTFRELGDNRQRCLALSQFRLQAPRPDPTLKARADAEAARAPCPAA